MCIINEISFYNHTKHFYFYLSFNGKKIYDLMKRRHIASTFLACVRVTYLQSNFGVKVELTYNGIPVLTREISRKFKSVLPSTLKSFL